MSSSTEMLTSEEKMPQSTVDVNGDVAETLLELPREWISSVDSDQLDDDQKRWIFLRYLELLDPASIKLPDHLLKAHLKYLVYILGRITGMNATQFTDEQKDVLLYLLDHADGCSEAMRSHIWVLFANLSHHTLTVPLLISIGCPARFVRWVGAETKADNLDSLLTTIMNLARHDQGAEAVIQANAIEAVRMIQREWNDEIQLIVAMILALLATPEQIKRDQKRMNRILDQILANLINASGSSTSVSDDGYHISELLIVFVKLFVDDRTLDYVAQFAQTDEDENEDSDGQETTRVSLFVRLLIEFAENVEKKTDPLQPLTLTALANIIWSISFHDRYKLELKSHGQLTDVLKRMTDNSIDISSDYYMPRHLCPISKAATGILLNLRPKPALSTSTQPANEENTKTCLMISYAHADSSFCREMLTHFADDAYDVWIDYRCCQAGDLWEAIAQGMEQAQVIVTVISKDYVESKSCRQEFCYAIDVLRKPIIPIILAEYRPFGWLGIRLSTLKYVRFRRIDVPLNPRQIENTIEMIRAQTSPQLLRATSVPSTNLGVPAMRDEVDHWFDENNLSAKLRTLISYCRTNDDLAVLAENIVHDWPTAYARYAARYARQNNGEELAEDEFAVFVRCLRALPSVQASSRMLFERRNDGTFFQQLELCIVQ